MRDDMDDEISLLMNVTPQHKGFLDRLRGSSESVLAVADWLIRGGRTVEIPAMRFAPTASEAERFFDEGDIVVVERKIIQVKRISKQFTGRSDWPFREYFISNKASVDRMFDRVTAYVTVSCDQKFAAIVDVYETKAHWYLTERHASNTQNVETFYACGLEYVKFKRISRD